jgi:hypothetical protein
VQQIQEPRAGVTYSPSDHQRRIDEIQAAIRAETAPAPTRSLFKPAPRRSPPSTDPLDHHLSEELECIRRHLEQLGGVLAGNPLLVQRHATQLQSIDLINQVLGHISGIIASEDRALAVEQVTLRELRSRLQRKPLSPL